MNEMTSAQMSLLNALLSRHNVYSLDASTLWGMVELLQGRHFDREGSWGLQFELCLAIFNLSKRRGEDVSARLMNAQWTHIPLEVKNLFYGIVSEFNYILNLKAYEVFFDGCFSLPKVEEGVSFALPQQLASDKANYKHFQARRNEALQRFESWGPRNWVLPMAQPSFPASFLLSFLGTVGSKARQGLQCLCLGYGVGEVGLCGQCGRTYHKKCQEMCYHCELEACDPFFQCRKSLQRTFFFHRGCQLISLNSQFFSLECGADEFIVGASHRLKHKGLLWPSQCTILFNQEPICYFTNYDRLIAFPRVDGEVRLSLKTEQSGQGIYAVSIFKAKRASLESVRAKCVENTLVEKNPLDPYRLAGVKEPSRGIFCEHQECFDLDSYLAFQQKVGLWQCPICSLPARRLLTITQVNQPK